MATALPQIIGVPIKSVTGQSTQLPDLPDSSAGPVVIRSLDSLQRSPSTTLLDITANPFNLTSAIARPQARLDQLVTTQPPTTSSRWWQPTTWRATLNRGWDAAGAAFEGAAATGTNLWNTAVSKGQEWASWARVNIDSLVSRAAQALGFASKVKPLCQMDQHGLRQNGKPLAPNKACYATVEIMGRRAGLQFSPKGGKDTLPAGTPEATRRFLGDLAGGIPVMLPVDYKPSTHGKKADSAPDHCIMAQGIVSWKPLRVRVYDPRSSNPDVQTQVLDCDPETGRLSGGNWPYRITEMRFATNVERPWPADA